MEGDDREEEGGRGEAGEGDGLGRAETARVEAGDGTERGRFWGRSSSMAGFLNKDKRSV